MKQPAAQSFQVDEKRIANAIARESRRRLGVITWSRSLAMVVVAATVATVAPWPAMLYYHVLIAFFVLSGIIQYYVGRSRFARDWHPFAFIAFDMALLVFTLIYPNPIVDDAFPPQFTLRFGGFIYLFLVIGVLAITLRPLLTIWSGFCGSLFWSIGVWWLMQLPGSDYEDLMARSLSTDDMTEQDQIARALQPGFIDLGVQLQNIVILLTVSAMLAIASQAARRLLLRETVQARRVANLSRYLPTEAITSLASRNAPFSQEREADVAVLFTDVVGFSALAEKRNAHQVISLLRDLHELVAREVFEHSGVLDKFIGDGAMATFGLVQNGATADTDKPAVQALACAQSIMLAVDEWNRIRLATGEEAIRLSAGVHWGPVVVGDVGSQRRMELAVIGDSVNVAARLETMTRTLDTTVAASEDVMAAAGYPEGFEKIGPRSIKGRAEQVVVWVAAP